MTVVCSWFTVFYCILKTLYFLVERLKCSCEDGSVSYDHSLDDSGSHLDQFRLSLPISSMKFGHSLGISLISSISLNSPSKQPAVLNGICLCSVLWKHRALCAHSSLFSESLSESQAALHADSLRYFYELQSINFIPCTPEHCSPLYALHEAHGTP